MNVEQFTQSQLIDMYRHAKNAHGWSDNSLAYDFGENLVANSAEGYTEDDMGETLDDFESIGDEAIALLEEAGYLTSAA